MAAVSISGKALVQAALGLGDKPDVIFVEFTRVLRPSTGDRGLLLQY